MTRVIGAVIAGLIAAIASVAVGGGVRPDPAPRDPGVSSVSARRSATPPARALSVAEINLQDRPPAAQRRLEIAAVRARPLIAHLPLHSNGVLVEVGGLAADGHTTVLTLHTHRDPAAARRIYRRLLKRYHDTGRAYAVQILP